MHALESLSGILPKSSPTSSTCRQHRGQLICSAGPEGPRGARRRLCTSRYNLSAGSYSSAARRVGGSGKWIGRSASPAFGRNQAAEGLASVEDAETFALPPIEAESSETSDTLEEPSRIDELPGSDPDPDPALYQLPPSLWPRGVPDLSSTASESLLRVRRFQYRHVCPAGELVFQPLSPKWLPQAVELLTDSFADLMGPLTIRPLLRLQVRVYLQQRLILVPSGVTLVGLRLPQDAAAPAQLVTTVELSLADAVRPQFLTLNPPLGTAYLCNMAVQTELRRQGVGRGALDAAEALAQQMGLPSMYLHCRLVDQGAQKLYQSAGYRSQEVDSLLYPLLLFRRRRALMRKEFKLAEGGGEVDVLRVLRTDPKL